MTKKLFFERRTKAQIGELRQKHTYRPRGLVDTISDLDPDSDALIIRTSIVPGEFLRNNSSGSEASRRALKWGDSRKTWLKLNYPPTVEECTRSPLVPLQIRERDFAEAMKGLKEEEIRFVGYVEQPNWGDRTKRVTPFAWIPKGVKLFAYAEQLNPFPGKEQDDVGVSVDLRYINAKSVWTHGAEIPLAVPSQHEKKGRYHYRLSHVPIVQSPYNLATILRMKPATEHNPETGEPFEGRTELERHLFRYPLLGAPELGPVIWRDWHDVAAYLGIIKRANRELKTLTPMAMNPFSLFGKEAARFYDAMNNNVLIYDPTTSTKDHLRHLHETEQSILWARAIKVKGFEQFGFWNWERDGAFKTYWPAGDPNGQHSGQKSC